MRSPADVVLHDALFRVARIDGLRAGGCVPIPIGDHVVGDEQPLATVLRCYRGGREPAKHVPGDRDVGRAVEHDARAGIPTHRIIVSEWPLDFSSYITVAKIISRNRQTATAGADAD